MGTVHLAGIFTAGGLIFACIGNFLMFFAGGLAAALWLGAGGCALGSEGQLSRCG